jgi:Protein of unknown function (DUF3102)
MEERKVKTLNTSTADDAKIIGFDYDALEPAAAEAAKKAANVIKVQLDTSVVAIGRELSRVKKSLNHGQFGAWLAAELTWSHRTADRYMAVSDLVGKFAILSNLPKGALYALVAQSTPKAALDVVVQRLEAGERLGRADVNAIIRDEKGTTDREDEGEKKSKTTPAGAGAAEQRPTPKVRSKLPLTFTKKTGPIIRAREYPTDADVFWLRVRDRGDRLVVTKFKAEPSA